jgi:CHASE2 domain-containing sensor protein
VRKKGSKSRNWIDRVLEPTQQERRWRIWCDFAVGIILTLALIFFSTLIEKIPRIEALKESVYDWLQFRLQPVSAANIAVVDFSDLKLEANPKNPSGEGYTSREELKKLVSSIVDQRPSAVGLDVDFSMGEDHTYFSDKDEDFLKFCLEQRNRVDGRLFVGINSGLERGPDYWLGSPDFKGLGRFIVHPNSEGLAASPWMDEAVSIPHYYEDNKIDYWTLQSLPAALVGPNTPPERPSWLPKWLGWSIARTEVITRQAGIRYKQFLVDFSPIEHFNDNAVNGADVSKKDLKDKIVIIGRGTRGNWPAPQDAYPVRGLRGNAYPGLLHHACAVYTLQRPLYHFTERGRWVLDGLFSFAVFGFITWRRLLYKRRPRAPIDIHKMRKRLTWAVAIFVFCVSELAVNYTRIVWADYFMVIIALFLHSLIEDFEESLLKVANASRLDKHASRKEQLGRSR